MFMYEGAERPDGIDAQLILRVKRNSFCLEVQGENEGGVALMGAASLANHSCCPNAACVELGGTQFLIDERALIARRPIALGEEITIEYLDVCQPTVDRRRILQKAYGFVCNCVLCTNTADVDPLAPPLDIGGSMLPHPTKY